MTMPHDAIEQIANTYGLQNQENQTIEECAELIQAINKRRRYIEDFNRLDNVIEELADVHIMIMQLVYLYGVRSEFYKTVRAKIDRQLNRITEENRGDYYEHSRIN